MYLHQQRCRSMAAAYSLPSEQPFVSAVGRDVIHTTCVDGNAAQFISQSDKLTPGSSVFGKPEHSNLLQPLLPEASV